MSLILWVTIPILIFIFFLLSKIDIEFEYKRKNEDDRLTIRLIFLCIKIYVFDISMIDISKSEMGYGFKLASNRKKKRLKNKDNEFIHFDTLINFYKDIKKYYRIYTNTLNDIIHILKKTAIIKKLDIKVEIGAFEHALTGIASGIIYALLWNIFCLIANNIKTKKHKILVSPRFDVNVFRFDFFCIYTIRIGNIIYVAVRLVILLIIHKIISNKKMKKANVNLNIN